MCFCILNLHVLNHKDVFFCCCLPLLNNVVMDVVSWTFIYSEVSLPKKDEPSDCQNANTFAAGVMALDY